MKPGDKVGEYIIEEPISVGKTGQADIYHARRCDGIGGPLAIKILADHLKADKKSIASFEEEAELLTKLTHKNIVRLESFDTSLPFPYIAQEYIEGKSLAETLKQSNVPLSFDLILKIALQVADALSYAHNLEYFRIRETIEGGKSSRKHTGIIHRDLSTDNILVTEHEEAKLIDFGIARAAGVTTITTATGIGKEFYVAPEVELGTEAMYSFTVDIYSFGVCLYEMLMTGRPERRRIDVLKQFQRNLHSLYGSFPDEIPEELKRIIVHCVQRESKDRPQSMGVVKVSLQRVQEQIVGDTTTARGLPKGLNCSSEQLIFDRILKLGQENARDLSMRVALNDDETRIFLLCDNQTKVYSFNLSGGERQVHHVPHGKRLSAVAGCKGQQALGITSDRDELLLLDETGEWHATRTEAGAGKPRTVPDNLVLLGKSLYIGDYSSNRVCRLLVDDGTIVGSTPEGRIAQLGPIGVSGSYLFCIDMGSKELLKADLELEIQSVRSLPDFAWPTSIAACRLLLLIIDAQNRRLSIMTEEGDIVNLDSLTWATELSISQAVFCQKTSNLMVLETSMPALLFFKVKGISLETLRLVGAVRRLGIEVTGLAYEAVKTSVLSSMEKNPEKETVALRFIDRLADFPGIGKEGIALQIEVYSFLLATIPPEKRKASLRYISLRVDDLGEKEKAKQLYIEYLNEVNGFDAEIRDKYGKLLELEENWEEIKDFEGSFLSRPIFRYSPHNRIPYEQSHQRLRKAYARLGIPLPENLRVPPTSELEKAKGLMNSAKYEDARRIFAEMIGNEDYRRMKSADAMALLDGYATSIKRLPRVLTEDDWQEVYRSLSILVRDYREISDLDPRYSRDMEAARRQIEKLKSSLPKV